MFDWVLQVIKPGKNRSFLIGFYRSWNLVKTVLVKLDFFRSESKPSGIDSLGQRPLHESRHASVQVTIQSTFYAVGIWITKHLKKEHPNKEHLNNKLLLCRYSDVWYSNGSPVSRSDFEWYCVSVRYSNGFGILVPTVLFIWVLDSKSSV